MSLVILSMLLGMSLTVEAKTVSITVQSTVIDQTPAYYGAVEGGHWNVADLVDCGMNSIRLYCDMSRIEPTDDDGVYGSPSIAEIKADPSIIPWSVWDERLNDATLWGTGVSLAQILADCAANGIQPLLCLRTSDTNMEPAWTPQPPFDAADTNEVWEYAFALAYWINVTQGYGFFEWQSFNEPDRAGQGWTGTTEEYAELVQIWFDAINYANSMAGVPTWNHVGNSPGWGPLDAALTYADPESQVADYHYYRHRQFANAENADQRDIIYGTDAVHEPLWNSEWGTYQTSYDGAMGMTVADDLYEFSFFNTGNKYNGYVRGTSIFVMWDWGGFDGLVNADGSKNASYWSHRLMNRCLQGGKDILQVDGAGNALLLATRDATNVYVVVLNNSSTFNVNLSPLGITNTTATVYNYLDPTHYDVVVDNPEVVDGQVSFDGVSKGVALLVVPL